MEKYVLVKWPESQKYMELDGVFLCNSEEDVGPCAYFVPEELVNSEEEQ